RSAAAAGSDANRSLISIARSTFMQSFDGKVALVTGAGRGIGKAVVLSLAQMGCRVVLAARTSGELEKVKLDIQNDKGLAIAVPTDLTRDEDIDPLRRERERQFGPVDFLINNAGWGKRASVVRAKIEDWDQTL